MDRFSTWTGRAHSILVKSHRKFKLNQARECLATWLGHRTYASMRLHDLEILHSAAQYVIIDAKAAVDRAVDIGFPVTAEQWREVEMDLRPSGVSGGLWLTSMLGMESAARLIFEDQPHPDIHAICKLIGMPDGRSATSAVRHAAEIIRPQELRISVHGVVRAFGEQGALAVPVVAEVLFERVGAQMYAHGELLSVAQIGPPAVYEPDFDGEDYRGSDD